METLDHADPLSGKSRGCATSRLESTQILSSFLDDKIDPVRPSRIAPKSARRVRSRVAPRTNSSRQCVADGAGRKHAIKGKTAIDIAPPQITARPYP